jgi:hypothetical protein
VQALRGRDRTGEVHEPVEPSLPGLPAETFVEASLMIRAREFSSHPMVRPTARQCIALGTATQELKVYGRNRGLVFGDVTDRSRSVFRGLEVVGHA